MLSKGNINLVVTSIINLGLHQVTSIHGIFLGTSATLLMTGSLRSNSLEVTRVAALMVEWVHTCLTTDVVMASFHYIYIYIYK